ncbi:MAG: SIR2 family protein [Chromatiales bacterium]|jgi:hypothetical protein|nr:SIR2 family protein [Chromatiales bacterium]MDX9765954.1 SIR2 family protein [Ectothiorhodospiraceae bacterium]
MTDSLPSDLIAALKRGDVVPYLGAGALRGAVDAQTGQPIPADSDSLIIAMNRGQPMAPKLMYEFPRAAMNLELKRGRSFVNKFLTELYGETTWTRAPLHDWLAEIRPPYVVDINRDSMLQDSYADAPHTLITGLSRIGGTDFRYRLHQWDGNAYRAIGNDEVDAALPILFKPMGTPRPEPNFIASDADYVDFITELMGGFAIPAFLKQRRKGLRYLFLGLRFTRDTERMVMSDIVFDHGTPTGWAFIPHPNAKERRFCARMGIEILERDIEDLPGFPATELAGRKIA